MIEPPTTQIADVISAIQELPTPTIGLTPSYSPYYAAAQAAIAQAAAEGLTFKRSATNCTGWKFVYMEKGKGFVDAYVRMTSMPPGVYHSQRKAGRRLLFLCHVSDHAASLGNRGWYATIEEAALVGARIVAHRDAARQEVEAEVQRERLSPEQCYAKAKERGVEMVPSHLSRLGFKGVCEEGSRKGKKRFRSGCHGKYLGSYETAEEAALAYATHLGPKRSVAEAAAPREAAMLNDKVPMTAHEAIETAAAEGLTLVRANNASGFAGVRKERRRIEVVIPARYSKKNKGREYLWISNGTVEEGALIYARMLGPENSKMEAADPNVQSGKGGARGLFPREGRKRKSKYHYFGDTCECGFMCSHPPGLAQHKRRCMAALAQPPPPQNRQQQRRQQQEEGDDEGDDEEEDEEEDDDDDEEDEEDDDEDDEEEDEVQVLSAEEVPKAAAAAGSSVAGSSDSSPVPPPTSKKASTASPTKSRPKPSWTIVEDDCKCSFRDCALPRYHLGLCMGRALLARVTSSTDGEAGEPGGLVGVGGGRDHSAEDERDDTRVRTRGGGRGRCRPSPPPPVCDDSACMICFEEADGEADAAVAESAAASGAADALSSACPAAGHTACGHLFHTCCLQRWLTQQQQAKRALACPVCSHPMSSSRRRFFTTDA